jgi:hypothetical protein
MRGIVAWRFAARRLAVSTTPSPPGSVQIQMTILNIVVPPFDPADEWLD